jgi:hypothetical protein
MHVIAVEYTGIEINTPGDAEKWAVNNNSEQGRETCPRTSTTM